MPKQQSIIKKKTNYLTGLKQLSNWLFSKRDEQNLKELIQKYEFDNTILKRLVSYVYNSPYIVWYINKYLNNKFDFNKFDIVDLLYSFGYILDINQKNHSKKLFYLKSNDLADKNKTKVKDLLFEYFSKIYNKDYNVYELNFFYDLITLGYISVQDVMEIDKHINLDKSSLTFENFVPMNESFAQANNLNQTSLDLLRNQTSEIQAFINEIKTKIMKRPECQKCELFGKPSVILDTNVETFGEVDLIFIGLNPGKDEVELDKPFVGKSGKLLREKMSLLPADIKWLITNVILCHTRNEKDIKNPEAVIANCNGLINEIIEKFPSKCYIPLGAKAASAMGITQSITSVSGKKLTSSTFSIIPMIHPSSAVNYGQMEKFVKDFETIYDLFKSKSPKTQVPDKLEENVSSKFITEITPDLTFFDVKEVGNKIIKIFIDQYGVKKYKIEDYNFKFYLKFGDWKQCNQITDHIDSFIEISGKDKSNITNKVRQKFNQIKNI